MCNAHTSAVPQLLTDSRTFLLICSLMSSALAFTSVPRNRVIAAGVVTSCVVTLIAASRSDLWTTSSRKMASSASRRPNTFVVNASETHTGTVIFLHGLGDTGAGWSQMFRQIREPHLKYIFPTASQIPVSLNGGMKMPSWFDLFSLKMGGNEDSAGIIKAVKEVVTEFVLEEKLSGIESERVIIGGFSQGGALALYSALTLDTPLAGAMGLSSWLPLAGNFPQAASVNKNIAVLLCHGDSDQVVSPQVGELTKKKVTEFVPNLTTKIYRGLGHSSSEEEMNDVKEFIIKCLPKK